MIARQEVGIRQSRAELLTFRVDGTGTASLSEGSNHGTLVDNGTGDYTITFRRPSLRTPSVVGIVSHTFDATFYVVASTTAIQIISREVDETDAAKDADFDVTLLMYYNAQEY